MWKYVMIVVIIFSGVLYALPNLFGADPSVQISTTRGAEITEETLATLESTLGERNLSPRGSELEDGRMLLRFNDTTEQLLAYEVIKESLGQNYIAALNLAPATPDWLRSVGGEPMYLGLDLRGGVHFLMEVDMDAAEAQAVQRYFGDLRSELRKEKIRYLRDRRPGKDASFKFRDQIERDEALVVLERAYRDLAFSSSEEAGEFYLEFVISSEESREIRKFALEQNMTTLRNRVNELGVAEPVVQQQGNNRIVVQLPGVQDTATAKEILGATATLEYRLVDTDHDVQQAVDGRVPPGSELYKRRDGSPVLLKKSVIVTGDQIINAASGIDSRNGSPMVSVTLDAKGAKKMGDFTRENVGRSMAVVFVEHKTETRMVDGEKVRHRRIVEEVINVATIREYFSKRFQTTGLDNTTEAHNLALLLRAGALAAPIEIVEERTVGPSLGKDNIDQGFMSVMIGFIAVLVFMAVYYRTFGIVANVALALNLVLMIAVLSMLQATLTLPGIAGVVLTVGMAVDANVLIFERIREEIANGSSPQASIHAGYEKAFSTIADANITTLIAAVVLFSFGTGPIKGFAVTLSIGIVSSMFTAIVGSRALINLIYGRRRLSKLSI
jgi:preprotein translocase subunit SecD